MPTLTVSDSLSPELVKAAHDGLNLHAVANGVPPHDAKDITVEYRENDVVRAALVGNTVWGWLQIKLLWVDRELRGQGIGRQLMEAAESAARERGCDSVHLDTFDYQAPEFYKKLGFTLFGQLSDFPVGHTRYFLTKKL